MIKIYTFLLSFIVFTACSSNTKLLDYRLDADRYCEVHSTTYREKTDKLNDLNKMSPIDKTNTLSQAFRDSIKTQEMESIIFDEGEKISIRELYPFLQKRNPELTQEAFNCPAIEDFYLGK